MIGVPRTPRLKVIGVEFYSKAYQLNWMLTHGYGLSDLMHIIVDRIAQDVDEDAENAMTCGVHVKQMADATRYEFLTEGEFNHGEMFACKDEFLENEYLERDIMRNILARMPESDKEKALYEKYTNNHLMNVITKKQLADALEEE